MIEVRNINDVELDENDERRIWRLLYPETLGGAEYGAVGGVASYKPSDTPLPLGNAHKNPELYYIIRGKGVVATPEGEVEVQAGDTFVNPPGMEHSIWSSTDEEMLTWYVAIRR
ncbi:hypothetical protein DVS28_a3543 [Euzebya pacifica]|uniref:Cupin type-2 domain-containing protein n=1 Tax=Euzebya pacifica TaxID=1608957 RepID=A0A346Y169_9ACTN|nr:cupin domain-containing protein [Euzebya pacifica]AXV08216.1 hypothetical protein DVS28_a3543 [Euzebya pacifica]